MTMLTVMCYSFCINYYRWWLKCRNKVWLSSWNTKSET